MASPSLNIIGCGNVGRTLARLWTQLGLVRLECVLNRSLASSRAATRFVGSGRPVESLREMSPVDLFMIATGDEDIVSSCRAICDADLVQADCVLFHCSGALASHVLQPAATRGAHIASIHPVKSFADPAEAVATFAGSFCAIEGDDPARQVLEPILRACQAATFNIDPAAKTIYHAGAVFVCNYLVALAEIGLRCFEQAAVPRDTAVRIVQPMITETIQNVLRHGTTKALTGPIARGETAVVANQVQAIGRWNADIEAAYRALGRITTELSATQGKADAHSLEEIRELLREEGGGQKDEG